MVIPARRMSAVLAALLVSGCAAADRESYSVAFSKKAHEYGEKPRPVDAASKPEIIREYLSLGAVVDRRPFRPFAYCTLHETDHFAESLLAVGAAPVEYPLVLAVNTGSLFVQRTAQEIARMLGFSAPRPADGEPPARDKDRNR